ncbi:cyanoexosortase B system-associated protein [Phormidium sp. CCY1219]|uniref:cyanoexosortase B system-associated protein n=1 Tax=Phormidium sp. CCY1219 TaxID=2886104 RepID=UPI002D1F4ED4|nr:cyanoexosortase B system-associated protein [Phormidium sp. CCY1219]MEB3827367.1 cyanoexosortase B system-associated protein [Phormidium sp. CCY1219]
MYLSKLLHNYSLPRALLLGFAIAILAVGAVPGYITGKWSWMSPPEVANLKQIKTIQESGLDIPGWKTLNRQILSVGGQKWLRQDVENQEGYQAMLLLFNQKGAMDRPQVEWMDIDGYWRWTTDYYGSLEFTVEKDDVMQGLEASRDRLPKNMAQTARVKALFFRSRSDGQTFAVAQWYAWPTGGNAAPASWFWRDRLAQFQRNRIPWVAASIILPMEPLGDLETVRPRAKALGKQVQAALMSGPFYEKLSTEKSE